MELREQFARKAFVGGLVSLVLSPLFVLLGYWLNHTLAAPKLRLEYATSVVIVENAKLDWDAVALVRQNAIVAASLRDLLLRIGISRAHRPCIEWLEKNTWTNDCAEDVKVVLPYYASMLDARVDELEKWLGAVKTGRSPVPVTFSPVDQFFGRIGSDKSSTQAGVLAYLETSRQEKTTLESFIKRFNATVDSEGARTGDIVIRVGVLNTGDSDGVITRGAVLNFGDSEVFMRAERYTVVKAHSFEQIEYSINVDATAARHLEKLRGLVRAHGQDAFEMKINGTDSFMSTKGRFPE